MGWQVPRRLVSAGDALPHRAHEEDRPVTARPSRTDPQLFPRSEAALQRGCRGPEQQSQTHNEKILRIPHLPLSRTRPLSLTCQITGAGINPRFFLTNLLKSVCLGELFGSLFLIHSRPLLLYNSKSQSLANHLFSKLHRENAVLFLQSLVLLLFSFFYLVS